MNRKIYKRILEKINFLDRIFLIIIFIATFSIVLFLPTLGNPDYSAYWKLFTWGDYYSKLEFGQLTLFTSLTSFLNNIFDYPSFRFVLASFQIISFSYIFYRLKFRLSDITFFTFLPFLAFTLLKIHVQIRESIAILFWMISLIDLGKSKYINLKNIALFIISSSMHISVILWWIPTTIYSFKSISAKLKLFLNLCFFSFLGVFAGSTRLRVFIEHLLDGSLSINIFSQISQFPNENFLLLHGPNIYFPTVEITIIKSIYWISCFSLIFLIWLDEIKRKTVLSKINLKINSENFFGFIGLYGSLLFLPFASFFSYFEGLTSHGYNYIFRILFILLFLLSLYRSLTSPRNFLSIVLNSFLALNILRILFNLMRTFINYKFL